MHFLIPSLGLSDIIHISVIIWNKITNRFRNAPKMIVLDKPSMIMSFLGGVSIFIVTSITFSIAFSIIYISANEKHSTINLVMNIMKNNNVVEDNISNVVAATIVCDKVINDQEDIVPIPTTSSIIDYLEANNQDSSFEYRQTLAIKYGISDYYGDLEQNIELISRIEKEKMKNSIIFDEKPCIK